MHFSIDLVSVHLSSKGILHLCRSTAESDPVASVRDALYGETLRFEPFRKLLHVAMA